MHPEALQCASLPLKVLPKTAAACMNAGMQATILSKAEMAGSSVYALQAEYAGSKFTALPYFFNWRPYCELRLLPDLLSTILPALSPPCNVIWVALDPSHIELRGRC